MEALIKSAEDKNIVFYENPIDLKKDLFDLRSEILSLLLPAIKEYDGIRFRIPRVYDIWLPDDFNKLNALKSEIKNFHIRVAESLELRLGSFNSIYYTYSSTNQEYYLFIIKEL